MDVNIRQNVINERLHFLKQVKYDAKYKFLVSATQMYMPRTLGVINL